LRGRVKLTKMLARGLVLDGRFRVLQNFAAAANSIVVAEELNGGRRVWLVLLSVSASAAEIQVALDKQVRFALGVPGLARPIASGVDAGFAFVAFAAPESGSVAEARAVPWAVPRVAALAQRVAAALGPLHDQGIAHGCVCPELIADGGPGDALFGFGVAALATRFGAAGEASQLVAPNYRAPELRNALLPPSPHSDVYALGRVLRELLSAPEATEMTASAASPTLSPQLEAVLARATAADPRLRPVDVREIAAELARCAELEAKTEAAPETLASSASSVSPASSVSSASSASPVTVEPPSAPTEPEPPLVERPLPPAPVPAPSVQAPLRASRNATIFALLVVIVGFVLMIGGVTSALVFAIHHKRPLGSFSASRHHAPPAAVAPRPTIPGPSDDEPPPAPLSSATPKHKPAARSAISHAPLVPPGVGPSTFPEEARAALPVSGSEPIWGTRNAPLTWVLFGDLDCPHTRHAWRALEAAKITFGDDLRIVFRQRPLREHPYALQAARVLAGLAKQRGSAAFFNVLHKIAQDDTALTDERLSEILNAAGFASVSLSELAGIGERVVAADLELAGQFAIRSTPLSFMNGLRVEGERTPAELEQLLLDERRSAAWVLATGASAKALYVTRTSSNLIGVGDQDTTRVCAPVSDSPTRGPADALVTLVEFSDFECPFCKQVEPTLKTLLARYPRALRLVWKNYPLSQHTSARLLANFAAEAGSRGSNVGFWAVHDELFARAGAVDDNALAELAGKAGLDGALLLSAARGGVHDSGINADLALGERLGVNATPTFFVNGRRIRGALPLDQFDALVRAEIVGAERIVARGVAREKIYRLVCDADD
jgi:protein-disulfide isomerase